MKCLRVSCANFLENEKSSKISQVFLGLIRQDRSSKLMSEFSRLHFRRGILEQTATSGAKSIVKKIQRAIAYIDEKTDSPIASEALSIETVAQFVHASPYHFHRQFSAICGLSLSRYIQLNRLKRAGYQLAFRQNLKVIDIALGAGYQNHESFTRAFKKLFNQSPIVFRENPDWESWRAIEKGIQSKMNTLLEKEVEPRVRITDFPETLIAVLEHEGHPNRIMHSVQTFIAWRKENKVSPAFSETYNILINDPDEVEPRDYRMDICATITKPVTENDYGVITKTIPAGRCAVLRHIGTDYNLRESFEFLYGVWLPQNGEEPREYPPFLHRVNLFPDVKESEMVTDIYIPIF